MKVISFKKDRTFCSMVINEIFVKTVQGGYSDPQNTPLGCATDRYPPINVHGGKSVVRGLN